MIVRRYKKVQLIINKSIEIRPILAKFDWPAVEYSCLYKEMIECCENLRGIFINTMQRH